MELNRRAVARAGGDLRHVRPRRQRHAERDASMGVPQALWDAVAMNPREAERKQVAQLLSLWDTRLLTALGGGGLSRFSELSPERREQVLLSWCDSRLPQRRAAFQALRKGALLFYYMVPGPNGDRSPVWDAIGYAGPAGQEPETRRRRRCDRWRSTATRRSSATSAWSARERAAARRPACWRRPASTWSCSSRATTTTTRTSTAASSRATARMYMYGGGAATHDQSVGLLAGSCLGGGTTVNYTTSFRTPDDVREEWASHGVPAFASDEYGASLDAVCERLGVNQEHNAPVRARAGAAARPDRARLARGLHAAQRARLRAGGELRLLRLRLPLRRQAVHGEDMAGRRARRRHANPRQDPRREGGRRGRDARRGVEARTADGPPGHRAGAGGGGGLRRDPHSRAAAPLRASRTRTSASTCACTRRPWSGACSTRRCGPGRARCRRSTPTSTASWTTATA